ncbi:MAG TPA: alanine racemase [Gammaproteobacteria bacterium]|jgi:alanine racemase|nr:alanine racemase [Gammaproteobacteria bacterium]
MSRATGAVIDLAALRHNLQRVHELAPRSRIMAVVKANAYGHGIAAAAQALSAADAYAVASLEEALAIRHAGLSHPIVLLEGVFSAGELDEAAKNGCELVVHDAYQLKLMEASSLRSALSVWLKVDSGMNRLGFPLDAASDAWKRLKAAPAVRQPPRLMTHLACADETSNPRTLRQLEAFAAATAGIEAERSIANSAGILAWPQSHADWVRPGSMLYGASPFANRCGADDGLKPAMTMQTSLIAVKTLKKGEAVGYGGAFVAPGDMHLGIAAIGYGDGYPRHAPSGTPVLVRGLRVPLVGRVAMDMIAVDLSGVPGATVGDPVVVWGPELPVEEIARAAGTIPLELLCGVTQRVKFSVVDALNETPAKTAGVNN